jgi:hypothetical protein
MSWNERSWLACPRCGSERLEHFEVNVVHKRRASGESGEVVTVIAGDASDAMQNTTYDMAGIRDGVVIQFFCADCSPASFCGLSLHIEQWDDSGGVSLS